MSSTTSSLDHAIHTVNEAAHWLRKQPCGPRILVKQTRNLGDTLHITPIARHFKTKFPACKIAFLVGRSYASAHEYNTDFDQLFPIDNNLNPQDRIKIKRYMDNSVQDLDLKICPSIFPFGEVWPSHVWSLPIISHQIFHNATIEMSEMLGDRKLHVPLHQEDKNFAESFIGGRKKCVALEWRSYSHTPAWNVGNFNRLTELLIRKGYNVISFGALNEGLIKGAMDGRGITWRRTAAILARCQYMIAIGSGIAMLAAAANPTPHIIEIGVSPAISMRDCGYADSTSLNGNMSPEQVVDFIIASEKGNS